MYAGTDGRCFGWNTAEANVVKTCMFVVLVETALKHRRSISNGILSKTHFPFLLFTSSIHLPASFDGTTCILTKPSITMVFPLAKTFRRLNFFPTLINPPVGVSM